MLSLDHALSLNHKSSRENTLPFNQIYAKSNWILRSGDFACIEEHSSDEQILRIINIATAFQIGHIACEPNDQVLDFEYPNLVLVNRLDSSNHYVEIWDVSADLRNPRSTITVPSQQLLKGCIKGHSLALLIQTTEEYRYQIHVIKDIYAKKAKEPIRSLVIEDHNIDRTSDIVIIGNHCVYSNQLGKMITYSLDGSEERSLGHDTTPSDTTKEDSEPRIYSLLSIGDLVISSQNNAIDFWDFHKRECQIQFPIDGDFRLVLSDGAILVGVDAETTRVWDVVEQTLLWNQRNKVPHQPSLTIYAGQIFSLLPRPTP